VGTELGAYREIQLVYPDQLKWTWLGAIFLGLCFAVPAYIATYSGRILLFAATVCVPLTIWCLALSMWCWRHPLSGNEVVDKQRILYATEAQKLLGVLVSPIVTILCLLTGLQALVSIGLIGDVTYTVLSLLCFLGIILSLYLPDGCFRLLKDSLRQELDRPLWEWLLGTRLGLAVLTALVFLAVVVVQEAVAPGSGEKGFGDVCMGPPCVAGAFLLVPLTRHSYGQWLQFRSVRDKGTVFVAGPYLSMGPGLYKESLPIWCVQCDKQGLIFVDDIEQPYFVVCMRCGWETSEVFCAKCVIGGEFVAQIEQRPRSWTCPDCGTEYALPASFYDEPVLLHLEEDP
jgi:hypothetical protein